MLQSPIVNYTRTGDRRMDLLVGIDHAASLTQARALALDAVPALAGRNPAREPEVFFTEFVEDSVLLSVRVWLASADDQTYLHARSAAALTG